MDPSTQESIIARIRDRLKREVSARNIPGAVVALATPEEIFLHEAFGYAALGSSPVETTVNTVYDAASLTKVVVTAPCLLLLQEEGRLELDDPVTSCLPELAGRPAFESMSLRSLLTHGSGLCACVPGSVAEKGMAAVLAWVREEGLENEPGKAFLYSDVNFVLLGEIVKRGSGCSLDAFAEERLFRPLEMRETTFLPDEERCKRCAATGETLEEVPLGVVHDPVARALGGVAGHAGLFSTASDLVRFGTMLLQGGVYAGQVVMSLESVKEMFRLHSPSEGAELRGLGWDAASPYSSPRGDLFPVGSFGHTGFTGTSLWLDPSRELAVCLLTNRTHTGGNVVNLRRSVANMAACMVFPQVLLPSRPPVNVQVASGIDLLRAESFQPLKGKRLGLLTHASAVDAKGRSTVDLLLSCEDVDLVRVLTPEHGFAAKREGPISDEDDAVEGVETVSLYGESRRPSQESLSDLDLVLVDLQDVGARFYTYGTTMVYCMEEASRAGIAFQVLDRPNPITGLWPEGPLLEEELVSFVGCAPLPIRHAMTLGELAGYYKKLRKVDVDLQVVKMKGWLRHMWFDETGLPWRDPSPNMRNLHAALLYPGLCLLERTNVSVGRGTLYPFERVGAPWMDGSMISDRMNRRKLPGVRFYPVAFTPQADPHTGLSCEGIHAVVTHRDEVRPVTVGVALFEELLRLYLDDFRPQGVETLVGVSSFVERLKKGETHQTLEGEWVPGLLQFLDDRMDVLLY